MTYLRTGLSWADSFRPGALDWFDRQMEALGDFDVTVTFCFTSEHRGIAAHHTSPPLAAEEFADFCAAIIRRYAGAAARPDAGHFISPVCRNERDPATSLVLVERAR